MQHAMRMRHNIVCGLFASTKIFSSINGTIFEKKVTELKMCVLFSLQRLP